MQDIINTYDNFESIFTHKNLFDSYNKCKNGVGWKDSVQVFGERIFTKIDDDIKILLKGEYPDWRKAKKIRIYERGKERIIAPVGINDRVLQRTLCDNSLVPVLTRNLITDNGASLKGKGVDFTRKRVKQHIQKAIKEYGKDFYILQYDFKSYFDSIPHSVCKAILDNAYEDKRIVDLTMNIIISYAIDDARKKYKGDERNEIIASLRNYEGRGICLGSQVSQVLAIVVPNGIDHHIKDTLGFKHYARYMDDGILISDNKETLKMALDDITKMAEELGLKINTKKTRIVKSSKGFVFMKRRYIVTNTGGLVINLSHDSIVRQRRKLKKLKSKIDNGKLALDDAYNSMQSWLATTADINAYTARKNMLDLYNELFDGYRITKQWYKEHKDVRMKKDWRWR